MLCAAVPKTTIHEYNNSLLPECKVRLPGQEQMTAPTSYAMASKYFY